MVSEDSLMFCMFLYSLYLMSGWFNCLRCCFFLLKDKLWLSCPTDITICWTKRALKFYIWVTSWKMSNRRRWRLNSYGVLELKNQPAQPFFSFTAPLYFQVQDQACVPASKFPRAQSSSLRSFTTSLTVLTALLLFSLQISYSCKSQRQIN